MSNKTSIIDSFYNSDRLRLGLKRSIKDPEVKAILEGLTESELIINGIYSRYKNIITNK